MNELKYGDRFTVLDDGYGHPVYEIDPVTRRSTGQLTEFVVMRGGDCDDPNVVVKVRRADAVNVRPDGWSELRPMVYKGKR